MVIVRSSASSVQSHEESWELESPETRHQVLSRFPNAAPTNEPVRIGFQILSKDMTRTQRLEKPTLLIGSGLRPPRTRMDAFVAEKTQCSGNN